MEKKKLGKKSFFWLWLSGTLNKQFCTGCARLSTCVHACVHTQTVGQNVVTVVGISEAKVYEACGAN